MPTPAEGSLVADTQKHQDDVDDGTVVGRANMSPEEETAAPPAALVAGSRGTDDEPRVTSPPSGSKFLHDDVPMTRLSEDVTKSPPTREEAAKSRSVSGELEDSWGTSDVEKFDGKIVYNPDGSAYIIEDSELSEEDIGDGCIVDGRGVCLPEQIPFPQIANAFYVSRGPSLYGALMGGASAGSAQQTQASQQAAYSNRFVQDKKVSPEVPIMHSYRVYTVRDGKKAEDILEKEPARKLKIPALECSTVPVKPILMCFICKLSFGYAKSFVAHAMGDHNVALRDDEKELLSEQNTSAIIQCVGKEKEPLVSFLEPLPPKQEQRPSPQLSVADIKSLMARPNVPSGDDNADEKDDDRSRDVEAQSLVVHQRRSSERDVPSPLTPPQSLPQQASPQQLQQHHLQHQLHQQLLAQHQERARLLNQHVPETPVSLPQNGSSSSNNFATFNHNRLLVNGLSSVMDLTRKSPVGPPSSHGRSSVSPGASPSPGVPTSSPLQLPPFPPPPPSFLTGTTIGVCPDHMGGRPSGADCPKCELILSSSRLGGSLANMHSRNSCKTLKCPKCNWHYKYQETLEIHMKEKHPESETSCLYCIAGQPHPRLARGETYTCGYKPYRCEVCNYSTTTKGNLSIHMQSDKHLNNMQELQNGGVPNSDGSMAHPPLQTPPPKGGIASPGSAGSGPGLHHSPVSSAAQQKPKPSFRCDVCNYETAVARNLRIHMTSEKHTHNMMVLQQSMKHMQTLSALQQTHQQQLSLESLLHFHPGLALSGDKPPPHSEAALADMAYNQALLIQMMTGGQMPPHIPPELAPHMDMGLNPDSMEPPPGPADPNPAHLFLCCVCNAFSTDSLEALSHHLSEDRTRIREQEILAVVAGHYLCTLCSYKTNLKANFQLHCKTDKHLQRLQHVNHIKEGGARNEYKLKYVTSPGGIQVRCHACDYYTNSAHKLQLHAASQRHEASTLLFRHLRDCESNIREDGNPRIYHCALCGFSARAKLPLLQHIRSMRHYQMEQLHQMQRRSDGKDLQTDIGEVFQVLPQPDSSTSMDAEGDRKDASSNQADKERERDREVRSREREPQERERSREREEAPSDQDRTEGEERLRSPAENTHMCMFCNYTSNSEMRIQAHVLAQHATESPAGNSRDFLCPLCQEAFRDRSMLEKHVVQTHSVNSEGLQRLLMLVEHNRWLNPSGQGASTPSTLQQTTAGNAHSPSSVSSSTGCKELQDSGSSGKLNNSDNLEDRDEPLGTQDLSSDEQQDASQTDELLRCHSCSKVFRNFDELCAHQTESGHLELKQTPLGPGYLCWKKGCNQYFPSAHSLQMHFREIHLRSGASTAAQGTQSNVAVSEKHVYKYRCNQCSLAFKTMEKLNLHSQYHMIRDATKCFLCGRSFRSVLALHKHVEAAHPELTEEELNAYKQGLMNNPLVLAGITGPVLDPLTTELLRKESMRVDDEVMDSEDSPAKDQGEELFQGNAHAGNDAGENSDDSIVYKDQQFLEDYLNSQAMAEDSYNDPNRKYKCHRCKVAYTRQSYLTSHNKTLLHRKGEKLTYPMEKYLDPNRPYKCDVCKESFTQKNILLVHYNSVSHLHKLKRAMQEQQNNNNNNTKDNPSLSTHAAAVTVAALASLGVASPPGLSLTPKSQNSTSSEEDDKKPYKCNICRVAYSQGSTLDIHMRSVLHQTRASKLQDLAISGQIDLSKPLIEQPEPQRVQDQHKKLIQDILSASPKISQSLSSSLTSPPSGGSSGSGSSQVSLAQGSPTLGSAVPHIAASAAATNLSSVPSNAQSSVIPSDSLSCPRCSAIFTSQEQLVTHQQLYCLFGSPMNIFQPIVGSGSPQPGPNRTPPPFQSTPEDTFAKLSVTKKSSQMYKHLLESFGFDLVMQFNENHQRRQRREREEIEKAQEQQQQQQQQQLQQQEHQLHAMEVTPLPQEAEAELNNPTSEKEGGFEGLEVEQPMPENEVIAIKLEEPEEEERPVSPAPEKDLPEVSKSTCQHCTKEFSSVWVLKAHCEEVHRDLVPLDFLEKYAQQFKSEYEKKIVPTTPSSQGGTTASGSGSADLTPEKDMEDCKEALQAKLAQQQTPPNDAGATPTAPSTPTASSTPASSTDSIPPTNTAAVAGSGSTSSQQTVAGMSPGGQGMQISLAQQMGEMQMALSAMAVQQHLQQFNPVMLSMMGLPLGLNMQALAAMNLQPPLVPMMMPPPPFDPMASQNPLFPQQAGAANMDPAALLAKQQQHLLQQQQVVNAAQQKRARTRITDEQLKILRAHFDINNSPSEEQIHDMANRSGLPHKVIKHWFRNTLFKERQRNKDSPYNFNNPPSTTLNLEEYEKTGEAKVTPIACDESKDAAKPGPSESPKQFQQQHQQKQQKQQGPQHFPKPPEMIKTEPRERDTPSQLGPEGLQHCQEPALPLDQRTRELVERLSEYTEEKFRRQMSPSPSPSGSGADPRGPSPASLTLTSIIASQLGPDALQSPHSASTMLPPKLTPPNFASPTHSGAPPVLPLTPTSRSVSPGRSYNTNSSDCYSHLGGGGSGGGSNGSGSSGGSTGKRANRTRFTDYQIKVLQEFFENNAYPKDDDLEYLSKLLSLSPRVIVVWFQNARQKARKVYENQPAVEPAPGVGDGDAGRFQRTPGLNYQCKKCLLVFQRYYELIRHQKTHCFKEEDAKRSAQAQAAAAQIAAVMSSEDSNSSTITEQSQHAPTVSVSAATHQQQPPPLLSPPIQSQSAATAVTATMPGTPAPPSAAVTPTPSTSMCPRSPLSLTPSPVDSGRDGKESSFQCDKCNLVFPRFELWREHQLVHIMNPNLFPSYPPDSPFGILQQHAQLQQQQQQQHQQQQQLAGLSVGDLTQHPLANILSTVGKRKFDDVDEQSERETDQPKDKRLRTTILPEQLDYLYQKYQIESNPSRKMLENIAREVGLKKRVVQVWFQNTRARERKGQGRAHSQVINKRCPFCPAHFKVKSALESHLTTKHADQCSRGEINIDALPDEEASMDSMTSSQMGDTFGRHGGSGSASSTGQNMMPPLFSPFQSQDMEASLKKYYEDSVKRYISELQAHQTSQNGKEGGSGGSLKNEEGTVATSSGSGGEGVSGGLETTPLDLSKPVDLSRSLKAESEGYERSIGDDDSMSECTDNMEDESNPTSPASSTQSSSQPLRPPTTPSTPGQTTSNKRFRTQMSSLQVKIMKSLFADYKTPTMAECEMLGREIGLAKRVVQVWFQNARAKEKKNKLALQKVLTGPDGVVVAPPPDRVPEECVHCPFKYSHKYSIQDHIFTKKHIDNVRQFLESSKAESGSAVLGSVVDTEFTVPPLPGTPDVAMAAKVVNNNNDNPLQQQQLAQLQMLQMAGALATKDSNAVPPAGDDMALLHQLYGFSQGNMLPMFSNNGGDRPAPSRSVDPQNTPPPPPVQQQQEQQQPPPTVGTPLSLLQLEPALLQAINERANSPGMSDLRLSGVDEGPSPSPPPPAPPHCRSVDTDAAFVCKKCRLAFPSEAGVLGHQRTTCCPMQVGWTVRLVQVHYECTLCGLSFDKSQEMRRHCDSEAHRSRAHLPPPPPPQHADSPTEALSPDMEEVVNQIAALAAKAAAESTVSPDSNANIRDFCQPQKATSVYAVPSTGH